MNSVYIEFHVENDSLLNKSIFNVERTITNLFETARRVELNDSESDVTIILYKIDKPIIKSFDESAEFFNNLDRLFLTLDGFSPHFTQFNEFVLEE